MKWMGWLGKLMIGAVLISFLSVFTTVYLVDQYVQAILERWNLSGVERPALHLGDLFSHGGETQPFTGGLAASEGVSGNPLHPDNPERESTAVPEEKAKQTDEEAAPPAGAIKASTHPEVSENASATEGKETGQALPVFGQSVLSQSLVMSAEEFNEKRKKLSEEDKLEIFTIMMKKLPQEELQKMSTLLEDGVTEEEVKQMEDVINAYLHQDDVARLLAILNKY